MRNGVSVLDTDAHHMEPPSIWPAGMADLENQPLPEASIRKIFWDNGAEAFGLA